MFVNAIVSCFNNVFIAAMKEKSIKVFLETVIDNIEDVNINSITLVDEMPKIDLQRCSEDDGVYCYNWNSSLGEYMSLMYFPFEGGFLKIETQE